MWIAVGWVGQFRQTYQVDMEFSALFFYKFGTVKGMVCHLDLTDSTLVRSRPYQCSPPCMQILREIVQDLMDHGVGKKELLAGCQPSVSCSETEWWLPDGSGLLSVEQENHLQCIPNAKGMRREVCAYVR
jgi:hypothetical protein